MVAVRSDNSENKNGADPVIKTTFNLNMVKLHDMSRNVRDITLNLSSTSKLNANPLRYRLETSQYLLTDQEWDHSINKVLSGVGEVGPGWICCLHRAVA